MAQSDSQEIMISTGLNSTESSSDDLRFAAPRIRRRSLQQSAGVGGELQLNTCGEDRMITSPNVGQSFTRLRIGLPRGRSVSRDAVLGQPGPIRFEEGVVVRGSRLRERRWWFHEPRGTGGCFRAPRIASLSMSSESFIIQRPPANIASPRRPQLRSSGCVLVDAYVCDRPRPICYAVKRDAR